MLYANEINEFIFQKFPFIMIDRIILQDIGKECTAIKNVTMTEFWAQGHFPGAPIFPGSLMIEAMAQAGGFIFGTSDKRRGYISAVQNVKFLRKVIPGDTLFFRCSLVAKIANMAKVEIIVSVDDEIAAKGVISYAFEKGNENV